MNKIIVLAVIIMAVSDKGTTDRQLLFIAVFVFLLLLADLTDKLGTISDNLKK